MLVPLANNIFHDTHLRCCFTKAISHSLPQHHTFLCVRGGGGGEGCHSLQVIYQQQRGAILLAGNLKDSKDKNDDAL